MKSRPCIPYQITAGCALFKPERGGGGLGNYNTSLCIKVLSLQKPDGSWVNENNRWWENDPVLVTSYSLLTLEFASGLTR